MSIGIVIEQMVIIFILIGTGVFLFKKGMVNEDTSKHLSNIVINITNPAILILSALDDGPKESLKDLGTASLAIIGVYIFLIIVSNLIPIIIRAPKSEHYQYLMISLFGNTGFLGIPLVSALIGESALIYVSICCLFFNILIYTYGLGTLRKAAGASDSRTSFWDISKKLVNVGTVSALITVVLYLLDLPIPNFVREPFRYAGNCTTYMSMIVLGIAVAQMIPREVFRDFRMYVYIIIRQILISVIIALVLSLFIKNKLILNTLVIEFAVPAGNMSLMFSKQLNLDASVISRGVIMTTLLSVITIPIVTMVL